MDIVHGKYLTQFSDSTNVWNTYYKNHLIASTPKHLWESEDIDFASRQAGEALLFTTIELTAGMINSIENHEDENVPVEHNLSYEKGFEKTDEGDVKDIETPSDKIEDTPEDEVAFILIKLQQLKVSLQNELKDLLSVAANKLAEGIDCTAELDRVELITKVLKDGGRI